MFKKIFLFSLLALSYVGNACATEESFAIVCVDNESTWKEKTIHELITTDSNRIKIENWLKNKFNI